MKFLWKKNGGCDSYCMNRKHYEKSLTLTATFHVIFKVCYTSSSYCTLIGYQLGDRWQHDQWNETLCIMHNNHLPATLTHTVTPHHCRSSWRCVVPGCVSPAPSTERPASESPCLLYHCVWPASSDRGEKETDRVIRNPYSSASFLTPCYHGN